MFPLRSLCKLAAGSAPWHLHTTHTIPLQMVTLTCLFNSLEFRIGNQIAFTFAFLSVQNGMRNATNFACGCVGSKGSSYQLKSLEREIANYISFCLFCSSAI